MYVCMNAYERLVGCMLFNGSSVPSKQDKYVLKTSLPFEIIKLFTVTSYYGTLFPYKGRSHLTGSKSVLVIIVRSYDEKSSS